MMIKMTKFKTIKATCYALALVASLPGTNALSASDLKEPVKVISSVVRLSDLFTGIKSGSDQNLFEAPMPGHSKQVSMAQLWKIALRHGIEWEKPNINRRIRITREGHVVDMEALATRLEEEVKLRGTSGSIQVKVRTQPQNLYLPVDADEMDIEISNLSLNEQQNRYTAKLLWPLGDNSYTEVKLNGSVEQVQSVPVLKKVLLPGEVVTRDDLEWMDVAIRRINGNTIQSAQDFIGQTPRRAVRANTLLRTSDFETLKVIQKGNQVSISYTSGPLTLTTMGKALENGAIGKSIRVMNLTTSKTIYATVTSSNQVEVSQPKPVTHIASR